MNELERMVAWIRLNIDADEQATREMMEVRWDAELPEIGRRVHDTIMTATDPGEAIKEILNTIAAQRRRVDLLVSMIHGWGGKVYRELLWLEAVPYATRDGYDPTWEPT